MPVPIPPHPDPVAEPLWLDPQEGTCLVMGSAWPMLKDMERALRIRPGAKIMAVNRAAQFVGADFLFTLDCWNAAYWRKLQEQAFGPGFTYHAARWAGNKTKDDFPWVDHWWPAAQGSATSSWGATKVAFMMGFHEVILCGVPLEPAPYADGVVAPTFDEKTNVDLMRRKIQEDTWAHPFVTSMSGWTMEFFGEPEARLAVHTD